MNNYTDKSSKEIALARWEKESGKVPEVASLNNTIAIDERQNADNENQHIDKASYNSFEQKILQKAS